MYHDYPISPTLFHWQSQSTTRGDSPTGRRYREHAQRGGHILLFVRRRKQDEREARPAEVLDRDRRGRAGRRLVVASLGFRPRTHHPQLLVAVSGGRLVEVGVLGDDVQADMSGH